MKIQVQKMLDAIKSGDYKKTVGGFIRRGMDGEERFCILGAITKEYEKQTGKKIYQDGKYKGSATRLQKKVRDYFGFKDACPIVYYEGRKKRIFFVNDESEESLQELSQLMEDQKADIFLPEIINEPPLRPELPKMTALEYMGVPFVDAHIMAEQRWQKRGL